jgi:uroporphyrinogen-III decarboxylase
MVEGKGSKDFAHIKRMMYGAPELYAQLMEKIKGHVLKNSSVVRRYHR